MHPMELLPEIMHIMHIMINDYDAMSTIMFCTGYLNVYHIFISGKFSRVFSKWSYLSGFLLCSLDFKEFYVLRKFIFDEMSFQKGI